MFTNCVNNEDGSKQNDRNTVYDKVIVALLISRWVCVILDGNLVKTVSLLVILGSTTRILA